MSDKTTGLEGHTTFACGECGSEIRPGDKRVPSTNGAVHIACQKRREARERYTFFIGNSLVSDGVSFSLWYDAGDREHILAYNTDGMDCIGSADKRFGNHGAIDPTEHFYDAVAYTFHWLQSYRPLPGDTERIEKEIETEAPQYYPNGKVPDQEMWALKLLLPHMYRRRAVPPEFGPLVEYSDSITAFRTPEVPNYARE